MRLSLPQNNSFIFRSSTLYNSDMFEAASSNKGLTSSGLRGAIFAYSGFMRG
jgi:hypothetical protein